MLTILVILQAGHRITVSCDSYGYDKGILTLYWKSKLIGLFNQIQGFYEDNESKSKHIDL
jgi:hypothetical protein